MPAEGNQVVTRDISCGARRAESRSLAVTAGAIVGRGIRIGRLAKGRIRRKQCLFARPDRSPQRGATLPGLPRRAARHGR